MSDRDILRRFGYNPDDPVPIDESGQRAVPDTLVRDLRAAAAPPPAQLPEEMERLIETHQRKIRRARAARTIWNGLTVRELEVVLLLADGCTFPEAGARLLLSRHTIETHMKNIRGKLQVKTTAHAVAVAFRQGLIK